MCIHAYLCAHTRVIPKPKDQNSLQTCQWFQLRSYAFPVGGLATPDDVQAARHILRPPPVMDVGRLAM